MVCVRDTCLEEDRQWSLLEIPVLEEDRQWSVLEIPVLEEDRQ